MVTPRSAVRVGLGSDRFARQQARVERRALAVGDYAVELDGDTVAAVEREVRGGCLGCGAELPVPLGTERHSRELIVGRGGQGIVEVVAG